MGEILKEYKDFKCGYVSIIGYPNAGKSTLLNAILGEKVAIVTPKPQTTRNNITGILTKDNYQIIFLDTPGIHKNNKKFNKNLINIALSSLNHTDIVYFIIDSKKGIPENSEKIFIEILSKVKQPIFLLLNKIDLVSQDSINKLENKYCNLIEIKEVLKISAKKNENLDILIEKTVKYLPESPPLYPKDYLSTQTDRFFAEEVIREKAFLYLKKELPYSIAVQVEEFKERNNGTIYILAFIYVEHPSQRKIVIGEGGKMLKKIGESARKELEICFNAKIFLELWVKVKRNWTKNDRFLKEFGYFAYKRKI